MKYDDLASVTGPATPAWSMEFLSLAEGPPGILPDDHEIPDAIAGDLRRECAAESMLVQWHEVGADPVLLGCDHPGSGAALARSRSHAVTGLAQLTARPFQHKRLRIWWSNRTFTAAMPLRNGILTLTGTLSRMNDCTVQLCTKTLETLRPFVLAYFSQWLADRQFLSLARSLNLAIERSGIATVLLDRSADIIYANSQAEAVFSQRSGLRRCGERMVCASMADTLRLQTAIDHVCDSAGRRSEGNPMLALPRPHRRALTIVLSALPPSNCAKSGEPAVIAWIFDPEQDLSAIMEAVCDLYGLSHRETQLACALVAGDCIKMAAKRLGVQDQTARSYLKQIFAKTETNRQTDLLQLLLKSAIGVGANSRIRAYS
ncbi:helix-turn-helix transcriptional regulator [Croceicoccus marinus]|uniref:HTH luxR-type domain-containing protein n=2 Tax=Croceicoccus marinus TaxID=450378 RepID=A0A7G6W093_9SPHN|nr:hypothetical protein [Croceicoccus marinus]QNE07408.1 hypothetical protein H4O24_16115 [Croceicoccus marinus]